MAVTTSGEPSIFERGVAAALIVTRDSELARPVAIDTSPFTGPPT